MRPKVAFSILLAGLVLLAAMVVLKQHTVAPAPPTISTQVATAATDAVVTPSPPPIAVLKVSKPVVTPEEQAAAVARETERLAVWSMNNDPQSLSNILGDLTSPEKEIRLAAIEAAKQFGSTNAVPVLRSMAANTDDHEEAMALLEAADFLELPDFVFPGTNLPPQ